LVGPIACALAPPFRLVVRVLPGVHQQRPAVRIELEPQMVGMRVRGGDRLALDDEHFLPMRRGIEVGSDYNVPPITQVPHDHPVSPSTPRHRCWNTCPRQPPPIALAVTYGCNGSIGKGEP